MIEEEKGILAPFKRNPAIHQGVLELGYIEKLPEWSGELMLELMRLEQAHIKEFKKLLDEEKNETKDFFLKKFAEELAEKPITLAMTRK